MVPVAGPHPSATSARVHLHILVAFQSHILVLIKEQD